MAFWIAMKACQIFPPNQKNCESRGGDSMQIFGKREGLNESSKQERE